MSILNEYASVHVYNNVIEKLKCGELSIIVKYDFYYLILWYHIFHL